MTSPRLLITAFAFLKRDFRIARSYQLSFILSSLNSVFFVVLLYFIGGMIDPQVEGLNEYGGFFAFSLIGYGFYQYFQLALTSFSGTVRNEQVSGCLEAIVATRTKPEWAIIFSSFYSYIISLAQLCVVFLSAGLLFHADFSRSNIFTALLAFILSTSVFTAFGILSASFIVVLKKGDPLSWLIITLNFVFGGAFFPIQQMPEWMQAVARFVPATYALNALRSAIIDGTGVIELWLPLTVLGTIAVVLMPLSICLFRFAITRAKKEGALVQY